MENCAVNIKNVLGTILKVTKKNANNLADTYLIKDPSIISKWKNDKATPTNDDILKIVDFTFEESSATQRKIMRNEIEALINNSLLKEGIKNSLLHIEDFKEFLTEVLNVSTSSSGSSTNKEEADFIDEDSEPREPDVNPRTANNKLQQHKTDLGTITAFSESIEGKYSGVVEFNMVLSKDRGENSPTISGEKNISFNSKGSFNLGNKISKLQKHLRSKSVSGTIIFVIIAGFLVSHAANGSQTTVKGSNTEDISAVKEVISITPLPSEEPTEIVSDKAVSPFESTASESQSLSVQSVSDDMKTHTKELNNPEVGNNDSTPEKGNKVDTPNNSVDNSSTNIADNSVNNSPNTTINKDASVEGDNNVMAQGSNIFINIGN